MPSKISSKQSLTPDSELIPTGKNQEGGAKRKREGTGKSTNRSRGEISKKAKRSLKPNDDEEEEATIINSPSRVTPKRARPKEEELVAGEDGFSKGTQTSPAKRKNKANIKQEPADIGDEEDRDSAEGDPAKPSKARRKRKTKEEKEAEAMPIAARTTGLKMFIGAHVSSAKGWSQRSNKVTRLGNAFALFLKSQRKWENPPLQDEQRDQFKALCLEHKYDAASHILPHGSYLVNLAQEDPEKAAQAHKAFIDDLGRCEALGVRLYNFHPGWTGPTATRPSALSRIANALNRALSATKTVVPVLETMAGAGGVIGNTFQDLADIIAEVDDKSRIGVCLDTCHVFAAGYDLREPERFKSVLDNFDEVVGLKYLKALHLNDSKAPFGSHRDLHANIGTGFLGLRAFHNIMNETRFENLPMVLETPIDKKDPDDEKKTIEDKSIWAKEIKTLEDLIGMDIDSDEFKRKETELSEQGREERTKHWEQYERKLEKDAKAAAKKGTKKTAQSSGKGKQTTLAFGKTKETRGNELSRSDSDDLSSAPRSP
ncbi:MAG: hypothetical protein Q9195_000025 [Heterodermia aff. obscurata]